MTADPAQPSASPPESSPETPVPAPSPTSAEAAAKSPSEIELETELAQVKDKALRALAEAENTRRRVEADKIEAVRYAAADFARSPASASRRGPRIRRWRPSPSASR